MVALEDRTQEIRETFPRTLDWLTFLVNLVLVLIAVAFLSLFAHSISLFRKPEQSFQELVGWTDQSEVGKPDGEDEE